MVNIIIANALNGELTNIEVENSDSIENLKALVEVRTSVPLNRQRLLKDGQELRNTQTIQVWFS